VSEVSATVLAAVHNDDTREGVLTGLRESREVFLCESIEGLVKVVESAGISAQAFVRMLDHGKTLEGLFELTE
jgi:hypothetical protein